MSNETNEELKDLIRDSVHELWKLPSRPDLEDDCCTYVLENYGEASIIHMLIEFLSNHCSQAVSSEDLKHISKENENE